MMRIVPFGSLVVRAPCARQKVHWHARNPSASGPALASNTYATLPQWQPPSMRCTVMGSLRCFLRLARDLFLMPLDRLHRGRDGRADETVAMVPRSVERGRAGVVRLEYRRRHVTLPEIVGLLRRVD